MNRIKSTFSFSIILVLLLVSTKTAALNYTISFTGTGVSSTVESVIVQNLTKGTTVTVPAGGVLNLSDQLNAVDQLTSDGEEIRLCPSPEEGRFIISFLSKNVGVTQISAYSIDGRKVAGVTANLQIGVNSFQLQLPKGLYALQVAGNGYGYTRKMINQIGSAAQAGIVYLGLENLKTSVPQKSKSIVSVPMNYTTGDLLLYKGISGNYSTILTDIPVAGKVMNFNFVECKDANGNYYSIVKIGSQTWMAENLKATKFRTLEDIMNLTINSDWGYYTISSWCNYNNDPATPASYGKLYNWYAVFDSRNIAPQGWHVASDAEWTALTTTIGGEALSGGKLKETSQSHWLTPNTSATNEYGFSALPGGYRLASGVFDTFGSNGNWWTLTENGASLAWYRYMYKANANVTRDYYNKNTGFSVRCVKDADLPTISTTAPSSITYTTAIGGGNITSDGGAPVTARGVCWSSTTNPTISNNKSVDGTGTGAFSSSIMGLTVNTTYYVRAYATNSSGTSYGEQLTFKSQPYDALTVTDADGNLYHTITIGNQVWMVENLKTTKYNDGTSIPLVTDGYQWTILSNPGYCWPNNDINNKAIYGAMYNFYTGITGKLAPVGWHVPSKSEIETLIAYLGGANVAGSKLKESGNLHWTSGNADATNISGFTAVPGGYRSSATGSFMQFGATGVWWTTSELSGTTSYHLGLESTTTVAGINTNPKLLGCNVRCIKNSLASVSTTTSTNIMSTSATCGSNVTGDGGETVTEYGICLSTTTTPTIANSKKSAGAGIGSFSASITGLTPNTTYYVRAYATNSLGTAYGPEMSFKTLLTDPVTVTDVDGNVYHTVTIGTQTWMVENLKTTKYNDGMAIPLISDSYQWINTTSSGYCWINNNINNKDVYGAMYNFYAVNTGKLAPTGWHVPTESDWITLISSLGGFSVSGSALKEVGTTHWYYPNSDATNITGFTAVPGGYRTTSSGDFINIGSWGCYWSSTLSNGSAWRSIMASYNGMFDYKADNLNYGFSVRCIKN